jgi:acetyl esterase/lipase
MRPKFCWWSAFTATVLAGAGCRIYSSKYVGVQRDLEYARPDGIPLMLDIYALKQAPHRLPVLIWIHGGTWKAGSKAHCPLTFLAREGFAVVSIEYRFIDQAPFPAQLFDCKGAIRWLRANADRLNLDTDRIAVFGASAGGHLAALIGTTAGVKEMEGDVGGNLEQSSRVHAICAFYPPTDLNRLVTDPKSRLSPDSDIGKLLGGPLEQNLDKAARANPINYITADDTPFFILHGEKDTMVPIEHSVTLHESLVKGGVESTLFVVPKKGHGIGAPPTAAMKILDFLTKHLRLDDIEEFPKQTAPAGGV